MLLLAESWLSAIGDIGLWGFLAVVAVCGAATEVARRYMRHQERMAMIQAGMDPDAGRRKGDDSE